MFGPFEYGVILNGSQTVGFVAYAVIQFEYGVILKEILPLLTSIYVINRTKEQPDEDIHFVVCSVYRKKRKYFCTSHFIRLEDIENIVLQDLREVSKRYGAKRGESYSLIRNTNPQQQERFDRQNGDLYVELYFDDSPY